MMTSACSRDRPFQRCHLCVILHPEANPMPQAAPNRSAEPTRSVSRQFTMASTLAAYSTLILVGITHHEPWADEAQAWLLSRDLSYHYLVFHQLAYEGHPPLWPTILWVANHWFHLPYQSLGWIAGVCAIAGCWFFARYSPFPAVIRVLLPFTYFIAFQYAIVARPYVLLPLFAFMAAHFFADAEQHPWRFIAATSALALLSATGVMLALGLTASFAWYSFRLWKEIPAQARKQLIGAAVAFCIVIAFVALVNWPPSDRFFARFDRPANENFGLTVLPAVISKAFFGSLAPSIAFLFVVGGWCAWRHRFLPFALPTVFLLVLFVKLYVNFWHFGALTLIAVTALWIAWPKERNEGRRRPERVLCAVMLFGVISLSVVQVYWSARTLAMDYSGAYSGSLDAAEYLRSVGADASSTCGFDYTSVAIQPYFPESIFGNWPHGESFWRSDTANRVNQSCYNAEWLVVPSSRFDTAEQLFSADRRARSLGYVPVHVSKGAIFFEGREVAPADFVVYRLMDKGTSNY